MFETEEKSSVPTIKQKQLNAVKRFKKVYNIRYLHLVSKICEGLFVPINLTAHTDYILSVRWFCVRHTVSISTPSFLSKFCSKKDYQKLNNLIALKFLYYE